MRIAQRSGDTNTGRKRRHNEDDFVLEPPLFAVADGMGGAQAGELASSLAAASLREGVATGREGGEEKVVELIQEANRRVHERATNDAAASGMGTTITVALFADDGSVTIGHVGDSRAYLLRNRELEQLTEDHSLVAELVRRGELSPEEAETHPQRSVITRALGTDPDVDVDAFHVQAQPDDVFLLCSDGLTTMVDVETIAELVELNRHDLRAAARALIKAANDRGGDDNITAVLFEVGEGDNTDATVEAVALAPADEEDTLHPEDGVAAIAVDEQLGWPPEPTTGGDTMVVSAAEVETALAARDGAAGVEGDDEPEASLAAKLVGALVIVLLAAAAVALVVWGLAR